MLLSVVKLIKAEMVEMIEKEHAAGHGTCFSVPLKTVMKFDSLPKMNIMAKQVCEKDSQPASCFNIAFCQLGYSRSDEFSPYDAVVKGCKDILHEEFTHHSYAKIDRYSREGFYICLYVIIKSCRGEERFHVISCVLNVPVKDSGVYISFSGFRQGYYSHAFGKANDGGDWRGRGIYKVLLALSALSSKKAVWCLESMA